MLAGRRFQRGPAGNRAQCRLARQADKNRRASSASRSSSAATQRLCPTSCQNRSRVQSDALTLRFPSPRQRPTAQKKMPDLRDHVLVIGCGLHRARFPAHVHHAYAGPGGRHGLQGARRAQRIHVVDHRCAFCDRCPHHLRLGGIHCDGDRRIAQRLQYRNTRRSSSAASTGCAPGRVDSPPTSMRSAPSSIRRRACAMACGGSRNRPPSEKESGVTSPRP